MLIKDDGRTLVLRIDAGEDVFTCFHAALDQSGAEALFIASAVGALSDVEFGVYSLERDSYERRPRSGFLEIVSLSGNVLRKDGEAFAHIHAVCSNPDLTLFGGHVMSARCGLTVEASLIRVDAPLERARVAGKPATYIKER